MGCSAYVYGCTHSPARGSPPGRWRASAPRLRWQAKKERRVLHSLLRSSNQSLSGGSTIGILQKALSSSARALPSAAYCRSRHGAAVAPSATRPPPCGSIHKLRSSFRYKFEQAPKIMNLSFFDSTHLPPSHQPPACPAGTAGGGVSRLAMRVEAPCLAIQLVSSISGAV